MPGPKEIQFFQTPLLMRTARYNAFKYDDSTYKVSGQCPFATLSFLTIDAQIQHGTWVGRCKLYYPDSSLCVDALFDRTPHIKTYQTGGGCIPSRGTDTIYKARIYSYKTYYSNGQLQREITYDTTRKVTAYHTPPHTYKKYFRNGHPKYLDTRNRTQHLVQEFDLKLRIKHERKTMRRRYEQKVYCYQGTISGDFKTYPYDHISVRKWKTKRWFHSLRKSREVNYIIRLSDEQIVYKCILKEGRIKRSKGVSASMN